MYLKSFIFLLCAYTLISAKPVSVSLNSGDNMAERPISIIRPPGDGGDPLKPTLTTEKRQAGSSSVTSGDGANNNTIVRDQQAGGNTVCNLSNYTSLLNAIQLNPLYAFSVMAELRHAEAVSRGKRQLGGSVNNRVIPGQTCRDLESRLNTVQSTSTQTVACPVVYRCHFNPTRYPRYLIQAESCQQNNGFCAEQNVTVRIAEFERAGSCNWNELSIPIRVGCQHKIRRR